MSWMRQRAVAHVAPLRVSGSEQSIGTHLALRRKSIGKGNGKGAIAPVPLRTYSVRSQPPVERPTYRGGVDRDPPT